MKVDVDTEKGSYFGNAVIMWLFKDFDNLRSIRASTFDVAQISNNFDVCYAKLRFGA